MALLLSGTGIAPGIAIAAARIFLRDQPEVLEYAIPLARIDEEVARLRDAIAQVSRQLRAVRKAIPPSAPADVAAFIDTHLLMLDDELLTSGTIQLIRERQCNAEWALKLQRDSIVSVFDAMADTYLRTRRDDVDHIIHRLQHCLLGNQDEADPGALQGRIVVARTIAPSDIVMLSHARIAGFITEHGSPLSHTAIMARSLGIPAITGVGNATTLLNEQETLVIDGSIGLILADADARQIAHFRQRQRSARARQQELAALARLPARTRDGQAVELLANIELPDDARHLAQTGVDGVGLFRTEYLFLNRHIPPDEHEQFVHYRRIVKHLGGKPVTIRTLDLGADKEPDDQPRVCNTLNPALGLRAIRRSLQEPDVFLTQLRAILRASRYGPVRIMFPMLTSPGEVDQAFALLETARAQLRRRRIGFDAAVQVGGMIETPAAALLADYFADTLDFLSIGTNDLTQYTLAIDRLDEAVTYLYDPLHPAVLRLIAHVLDAGLKAGTPVALCGEMAGDPQLTRLLLLLGLREFSVRPNMAAAIKDTINRCDLRAVQGARKHVEKAQTAAAIASIVAQLNAA